jgi:hypothetical protein
VQIAGPEVADDAAAGRRLDLELNRSIAGPVGAVRGAARLDLTTVRRAADDVESYVRADGTKVWSLM